MPSRKVALSRENVQRQAQCSAERAIEELVWNALDAGGMSVRVAFESNEMDGATDVVVTDSGSGIPFPSFGRTFGTIGMSIKLDQRVTPDGRALHGTEGRGRFRAVVLGTKATWKTTYLENGTCKSYEITIRRSREDELEYTDPVPSTATPGTEVRVEGVDKGCAGSATT